MADKSMKAVIRAEVDPSGVIKGVAATNLLRGFKPAAPLKQERGDACCVIPCSPRL